MKIKKKDLRKREAQLPINYPDPEVVELQSLNDAFFRAENTRVEELCKRLAHNEVVVRDAVLAEIPRYIRDVTRRIAVVEEQTDMTAVRRFVAMRGHGRGHKGKEKHTNNNTTKKKRNNINNKGNKERNEKMLKEEEGGRINVLREVSLYRSREENARREQRRQEALQQLKEQEEQQQLQQQLHYNISGTENKEAKEKDSTSFLHADSNIHDTAAVDTLQTGRKSLRQMHREWVTVWADTELLLLKLTRGVFFCLWHSDKPLVQLECAQRIARLIHAPRTNSGKILFFSCLMRVLAREWRGMDRYRADKFLALVRKMVYELLTLLKTLELETKQQQEGKANGFTHKTSPTTGGVGSSNNNNSNSGNANTNKTNAKKEESGDQYHDDKDILKYDPLCRGLDEVCYVFQEQIVPEPTAVGLTMHIADILFDEFCRAALSPTLFVALSDRVALYAMSQGNFVEKRILDYFVSPIAGGMLAMHRLKQQQQQEEIPTAEGSAKKRKRDSNNEHVETHMNEKVAAETNAILLALADCCKRYAVGRHTVRPVRVMFSESELALRRAADPSAYRELTRGELRRRVEREVEDVEETRRAVVEERRKVRLLKKKEKRGQINSGTSHADDDDDNDTNEEGGAAGGGGGKRKRIPKGTKATRESSEKGTKKKHPRDTKRKKHYTLTREDLYGEE